METKFHDVWWKIGEIRAVSRFSGNRPKLGEMRDEPSYAGSTRGRIRG